MVVGGENSDGWVLAGLVLAQVPRLRQAGLGEHVRLVYVMSGLVADPRLNSTCPPSTRHHSPSPSPSLASVRLA